MSVTEEREPRPADVAAANAAQLIHDEELAGAALYSLIKDQQNGITFELGQFTDSDNGYMDCVDSVLDRLGPLRHDVSCMIGPAATAAAGSMPVFQATIYIEGR